MLRYTARTMSSIGERIPELQKASKKALRKEIKIKVANIPMEERIKQSQEVTHAVLQMPEYKNAKSLAIYLHMNDEIQTEELLEHSLASNKKCYIPRYFMGGNRMEMVELKNMDDYNNLPTTKWNIKQPKDDEPRPEALDHGLDLILVPGMAFNLKGHRLGRGKGYYDTYLAKCLAKSIKPVTIALAFKEQVLDEIPVDDHDFLIDKIIYPQ